MTDDAKDGTEPKPAEAAPPTPTPKAKTVAKPKKPKPAAKRATAVRNVWVVIKGEGLVQVPSDRAKSLVDQEKARRATPRDLAIAGVTGAPEEE